MCAATLNSQWINNRTSLGVSLRASQRDTASDRKGLDTEKRGQEWKIARQQRRRRNGRIAGNDWNNLPAD